MIYRKNQILTSNFNGQEGLYCSVRPLNVIFTVDLYNSMKRGLDLLQFDPSFVSCLELTVPSEYHCTVMYSKDTTHDILDINTELRNLGLTVRTQFDLVFQEIDVWRGHDGEIFMGIVWKCPFLTELNRVFKARFGCVPSFDEYLCHTTIASTTHPEGEYFLQQLAECVKVNSKVVFNELCIKNIIQ